MLGIKDCEVINIIPGKGTEKTTNEETGEERTVVQESLRIKVSVEHVDVVRDHFYLTFSEREDENFPVTGQMECVPKHLLAKISKKLVCDWAYKQNQWCTSLEQFTLRGTHNIDMEVRKKDGRITSLRKELLRTKDAEGNEPIQMVNPLSITEYTVSTRNMIGS